MKAKIKRSEKCRRFIDIIVPKDEVERAYDEVYAQIQKTARIQGFRPGKAPLNIVQKYYGSTAREEVLRRIIPESYKSAVEDLQISAIGLPSISDVKVDDNSGGVSFVAIVDVRPEFKLKNYKGLKLIKEKKAVDDKDVQKVLEYMQENNAEFEAVENRGIQMGDYIVCDIKVSSDEKVLDDKKGVWLRVDRDFEIKGFCEQMVGVEPGHTKEVKATLPKDYPSKEYASKDVLFKVKVDHIKSKKVKPVDDEFAKQMGKYASLAELKDHIKRDLDAKYEAGARAKLENDLLSALVKAHEFDIPESLAEAQTHKLVEHTKRNMKMQGLPDDKMKEQEAGISEKVKGDAVNQVKTYFILNSIADKEQIAVKQEDIDAKLEEVAKSTKHTGQEMKKYLEEKDMFDDFVFGIREEKTIEFLLNNAVIE